MFNYDFQSKDLNLDKNQPLVSVLMTAYNREKYIAEAIESVLNSTYRNFELIIVDDASTDATVEIAKRYKQKDKRIKVYVNEKNLGQFPNRNKAVSYSSGSIIMSVDSDDTIKSEGIEYVVKQFDLFPNAKFASVYGQPDIKETICLSPEENIRKHFYKSNHLLVGPGGTVIKKDFFQQIGGFPVEYGPAGDCYYNIKAASNADALLLPYVYFNYRVHGNQEFFKKDSYLFNSYLYFKDALRLPELPLSLKEKKELNAKNKRNFLFNTLIYFKNTGKINKTMEAYRKAGVGIKEILTGIF